ncbi:MAG: phage portal protein [Ramlibacter sp.]|nr:phage portal protein [Ramlibacter sp.]
MTRPLRNGGGMLGWLREPYAGAWQRGAEIEPMGALTAYGAVYACVSRIANDIGKLQPRLMVRADRLWVEAPDEAPHNIPLRRPNHFQNRIQFFTYWLICKLIHGNTYAFKERDDHKRVRRMYLLDPRRVVPLVTPTGDVYYNIGGDDLAGVPSGGLTVPASEIIHDRMNCLWHPLVGISPIYACGISATQGLRIQRNSNAFFANMSRPSGMLTAPATIDEPTAERLKATFEQNFGHENIGRLFVAGDGLKYEAMTIAADEAQLIEQLEWTVKDVARAFSMPLYKIGAGDAPAADSADILNQQYYDDCLQPHIEALELCLDEGLQVPDGSGVEFDLRGLLRMDQMAQIEKLAKAVGGGIMAPNEARAELNLPALDGGGTVYLQQQNFSLAALAKRDARPDPFAPAPKTTPPAAEKDVNEFVRASSRRT